MKILNPWKLLPACWLIAGAALAQTPDQGGRSPSWKSVEKILGRPGIQEGDRLRVDFPRTDLNVTVNGIPVEPELALTTWFLFRPLGKGVAVRGEMVLLDQEVPKVVLQLRKMAFKVSEAFAPLLNESPAVKTLYIEGQGSRTVMAQALNFVLAFTGTPQKIHETPAPIPTPPLTPEPGWSGIPPILGPGSLQGNVLVYTFKPDETKPALEFDVPPYWGLASDFRFQKVRGMTLSKRGPLGLSIGSKTSREVVASAGHFLLLNPEVEPVLDLLKNNHIKVTSKQAVFFDKSSPYRLLYFWAQGAPEEVASGLKEVLGKMNPTETK